MTIDSVDAHDGHPLTKGHAGAAVLPALLALADAADGPPDGRELLTALVIGYEVAIRAGIALHATASDYHTSGAWNALGAVAVANRLWRCDERHLREALGIAEYHGPRSPMMRCIDHPTMLKDGSGLGRDDRRQRGAAGARRLHRGTCRHGGRCGRVAGSGPTWAGGGACWSSTSSRTRSAAGPSPRSRRPFRFAPSTVAWRRTTWSRST